MVEKQKVKAMDKKWYKARRKSSLPSELKDKSNIKYDTNPDKANDKYSLQF